MLLESEYLFYSHSFTNRKLGQMDCRHTCIQQSVDLPIKRQILSFGIHCKSLQKPLRSYCTLISGTTYNTSIFFLLYYFLIYLVLVRKVYDKCGPFISGKNIYSFPDISQGWGVVLLHSFCPQTSASEVAVVLSVLVSFRISEYEDPLTQHTKHCNYFHFLVSIGHGTNVNNNLSLWTTLYLYISDPITIGTVKVYFIFISVLLVLFQPRGEIK